MQERHPQGKWPTGVGNMEAMGNVGEEAVGVVTEGENMRVQKEQNM